MLHFKGSERVHIRDLRSETTLGEDTLGRQKLCEFALAVREQLLFGDDIGSSYDVIETTWIELCQILGVRVAE